jgi:hypothetical protein
MSKSANKQQLVRIVSFCSLILSILWSCSNNKKNHNTTDINKPEIIYDTIDFTNQPPVNVQGDTNLYIDGNVYHLSYSVSTDYVFPIKSNDTITEENTMYINTYIGDNTKFRIVLTETNGLVIFDKTYHKYHFLSNRYPLHSLHQPRNCQSLLVTTMYWIYFYLNLPTANLNLILWIVTLLPFLRRGN